MTFEWAQSVLVLEASKCLATCSTCRSLDGWSAAQKPQAQYFLFRKNFTTCSECGQVLQPWEDLWCWLNVLAPQKLRLQPGSGQGYFFHRSWNSSSWRFQSYFLLKRVSQDVHQ